MWWLVFAETKDQQGMMKNISNNCSVITFSMLIEPSNCWSQLTNCTQCVECSLSVRLDLDEVEIDDALMEPFCGSIRVLLLQLTSKRGIQRFKADSSNGWFTSRVRRCSTD